MKYSKESVWKCSVSSKMCQTKVKWKSQDLDIIMQMGIYYIMNHIEKLFLKYLETKYFSLMLFFYMFMSK